MKQRANDHIYGGVVTGNNHESVYKTVHKQQRLYRY